MKHTYCCITLVEHEMKSTVTHTSLKLSGDMNSAHTPAGVSPKKASIFCQRRERERERERERDKLHSVKNLVPYQAKI
jgi:hypothetical protein